MRAPQEPSLLRREIGAAGRADGNPWSDIPISGGEKGWVSASTSSCSPRLSPFLLAATSPHAHLAGLMQHLSWGPTPSPQSFRVLVNPFPALGPASEACDRAGRAEELRAQWWWGLWGDALGLQLLPGPISQGKWVSEMAFR